MNPCEIAFALGLSLGNILCADQKLFWGLQI